MNGSPPPSLSANQDVIQLAHGGGGRMMQDLIRKVIEPAFRNPLLEQHHDGAVFAVKDGKLAFTADSFVVSPLFFPGGDIGSLAVNGVVNDLAMCGAEPWMISAALILEEGLTLADLTAVVGSMAAAAAAVGAQIVTGDTKVVERGKGDGMFISTSGIGRVVAGTSPLPAGVRAGDAVLVSGDLGRHGTAVMAARMDFSFDEPLLSDCAPLWPDVRALLDQGIALHCLRDLTRGGLAAALVEIAETIDLSIEIEAAAVPVSDPVRAVCELLGLDPINVANEGRFIAIVPHDQSHLALSIMRQRGDAAVIGHICDKPSGTVVLKSPYGPRRRLHLPSGEQLPRIC